MKLQKATPDTLPEVSFNVELGKKYQSIDFDYDEYSSSLRRAGLSHDEIAAMRLNFNSGICERTPRPSKAGSPKRILGHYSTKPRLQVIHDYGAEYLFAYGKFINQVIMHETGHAYDHMRRGLGRWGTASFVFETHANKEAFADHFETRIRPSRPLLSVVPQEQYIDENTGNMQCFINSWADVVLVPVDGDYTDLENQGVIEVPLDKPETNGTSSLDPRVLVLILWI